MPALGWWNVTIEDATQRLARSGEVKLVLRMTIDDEALKGRVVFGHISLGEHWRARQIVQSLQIALNFPTSAPLPDYVVLIGQKVRVLVTAWTTADGQVRESVAEFAAVGMEEIPF